ncbi:MAG: Sec-independent protein translocase protein TatB [Gammaproteobacteria bacterium]|jgi:sec-independent protein translocase protein TatB|nr:Sec-independent protein translocase protein TatB [Gammaproteobacteria bacterium]MDP6616849.1 Sec-independent protein translocase protein TatB [Gammaproteobacteria bacterium]MDP6694591.1 Sec-independent protein translocase protein TatB [Gammaproteobacteria bacterium]
MFDIGFWELAILFGLGLMVLGPERMPRVAAQLGRWAGQARSMARNLTQQFREELEPLETMHSDLNKEMNRDFSKYRPDIGEHAESEDPDEDPDEGPDEDSDKDP